MFAERHDCQIRQDLAANSVRLGAFAYIGGRSQARYCLGGGPGSGDDLTLVRVGDERDSHCR
jgi:hypothetical protein